MALPSVWIRFWLLPRCTCEWTVEKQMLFSCPAYVQSGPKAPSQSLPVCFPDLEGAKLPIPPEKYRTLPALWARWGSSTLEWSRSLFGTSGIQGHISHGLISLFFPGKPWTIKYAGKSEIWFFLREKFCWLVQQRSPPAFLTQGETALDGVSACCGSGLPLPLIYVWLGANPYYPSEFCISQMRALN